MREKLYKYLSECKKPTSSEELVKEVLAIRGANSTIADRIIEASAEGDARFVRDNTGNWYVAKKKGRPLAETEFVICQLIPMRTESFMHIRSVACCRLENGKPLNQNVWNILWSRGKNSEADDSQFSPPERAFAEISRFMDNAVLVMDGFGNQYSMLNTALRWVDGTELENEMLSLRSLANHLYADDSVSSLSDLGQAAGVPFLESEDPLVRISNITEVFLSLLGSVSKRGIQTVDELLDFCYPQKHVVDYSTYAFDHEFIDGLPAKPGVYIMRDKSGAVIYVGKAKNLSRRVGSYFLAREQRDAKTQNILEMLYDLEIHVLGSELEALLEENRLISEFNPPINSQLEVHSRKQSNWQSQIIFLPSRDEEAVELFLIADGDARQVSAKKDLSNLDEVEKIVSDCFFSNSKNNNQMNKSPAAAAQITARWLQGRKDVVTCLEMKWVPDLKTCMVRTEEYILDFGMGKVIHI